MANMPPLLSTIGIAGNKDEDIEIIISTLPKEKGLWFEPLYKYQGFWFEKPLLDGTLIVQKNFEAQPNNVVLATHPKAGTNWFASLLFTTMNRTRYDFNTHPLRTSCPLDCVPILEIGAAESPSNQLLSTTFPLFSVHIPYSLLPSSMINSTYCPIIYVCRDPEDMFVSLWHFANKLRPKDSPPLAIEDAFDMYCKGVSPYGSYWDHVLEYWKASIEMPNKVLFVRYEDMKSEPIPLLKKVADFVGCPFSSLEEENGVIDNIVDFCSFENLSNHKVNRAKIERKILAGANVTNDAFFRKGKVGDHKNYLSDNMIKHLKDITEMKFKGSGLVLHA